MKEIISQVVDQLDTWKYKRAQPYKMKDAEKIITEHVNNNLPIPLFGYWGIGNKDNYDEAELNTVNYLSSLAQAVKNIYNPGIKITFILSDVHANNNCISKDVVGKYIEKIKELLEGNNFDIIFLSDLYDNHGLSSEGIFKDATIKDKIWWQFFPLKKDLLKQANNVALCEDKSLSARRYAMMRMAESRILEKEFANQIFITYSSPHYRILYPNLPTLYLYSEKKGCCVVPWFNCSKGLSTQANEA